MKTTITVGQSVQIFHGVGLPESWNKISISREYEDVDNVQVKVDELFGEIQTAHKIHSQSCVDSQIAPAVKKETFADLKKELHVTPK